MSRVGVPVDLEVETPPPGDSRLPDVPGLDLLLGVERRVAEILDQEPELLLESLLDVERGAVELLARRSWSGVPLVYLHEDIGG